MILLIGITTLAIISMEYNAKFSIKQSKVKMLTRVTCTN